MRVLVCGSRDYRNQAHIAAQIQKLNKQGYDTLIEGEARGADTLAKKAAKVLGMWIMSFPADWKTFGNRAGYLRNKQMLDESCPNLIIAFFTSSERSKGTSMMISLAQGADIPYLIYEDTTLVEDTRVNS